MSRRKVKKAVIKGNIVFEKYKRLTNGRWKKVSTDYRPNRILNLEHWRDWQKGDRYSARVTLRKRYDYAVGVQHMESYTVTTQTEKKVYKYRFDGSLHKTGEYEEYYE